MKREAEAVSGIRSQLDEQIARLEADLVEMMEIVTERIGQVTSALLEGDVAVADVLIAADDDIDLISLRVDKTCIETLMREQPVASDLRFVVAAMHMNSDIERSGDLTTNIAKAVGRVQGLQIKESVGELIPQMAAQAQLLFRRSQEAFVARDPELAASIDELDDALDDLHYTYIQEVIHEARLGGVDPQQAVQLALVGRFYERIGDHAENLGERIRYIADGWLPESIAEERIRRRVEVEDGGRDITSRGVAVIESIAEQRRVDAIRQDFVANVSHELKTPVGAMTLLADALSSATDSQDRDRLSALLQKEARRAEDIIDDLLELARLDEQSSTFTSVEVDEVVSKSVDIVSSFAKSKRIELVVTGLPSSQTVHGNSRELGRALVNLLDNAIRSSEPATTVTVRVEILPENSEISVTDSGVGIPRTDLERIFERFYRVDRARSRSTGGTGLGLAIVRHVAGNHNGSVMVESKLGSGSTFTLRLPTESL